jgi:hypothetical protein
MGYIPGGGVGSGTTLPARRARVGRLINVIVVDVLFERASS